MTDQGLALAAMFQCAGLVDDLAHQRPVNDADVDCLLNGLFIFDAPRARDIYQPACLHTGRQVAQQCLASAHRLHLIGYLANMTALQARLAGRANSSNELRRSLERIHQRHGEQGLLQLQALEELARLYTRHISPLSPRIMVQGKPQALRDTRTVATIRSLLLAGVRAARLWVHTGGNRWQLVFRRSRLLREIQAPP